MQENRLRRRQRSFTPRTSLGKGEGLGDRKDTFMKRSIEIPARGWRCVVAKECEDPMGLGMIELPVAAENEGT